MKRFSAALFSLLVVLILSCNASLVTEKMGRINVTLPSKKTIDMAFAQANSDVFTVIAYNEMNLQYLTNTATDSPYVISLPVGNYKVLVLAGKSHDTSNTYLGGGLASEVQVVEGQTTPVTITLDNLDFNFSVPSTATAGGTVEVSFSYDLRIPVVIFLFPVNTLFAGGSSVSFNETTKTAILPVPQTIGPTQISFQGVSLRLWDTEYGRSQWFNSIIGKSWCLPSPQTIPSETVKDINILEAPSVTALSVMIEWGAE